MSMIEKDEIELTKPPWGAKWRSSTWYITALVAFGVLTDTVTYIIVVPILPYRLQSLNYTNISTLTSWLLFSYAAGLCIFSFPIAYYFHIYPYRRGPLVIATLLLEGSLILFMLVKPYWIMVIARFIQGSAAAVVWNVGFALICENVPDDVMGRQLGFAFSGVAIGTLIGPPIGGALYASLGWNAVFIFCIICCAIELIARILVIEQKQARRWRTSSLSPRNADERMMPEAESPPSVNQHNPLQVADPRQIDTPSSTLTGETGETDSEKPIKELSPLQVLATLLRSPRGVTALSLYVCFGLLTGIFDPTITLRIENVWNKDARFVGLAYLAASAPVVISGPLTGFLCDKYGAEWIAAPALMATLPWVPGFIVYFALMQFFLVCVMTPSGHEVAIVAKNTEGLSEIHQFAAINVAFAVSSSVGAVIGGQMYDHIHNGWSAVCWYGFVACVATIPAAFCLIGDRPLAGRLASHLATWRTS